MEFPNVPVTGSGKAVRISMSASVASDIGSFTKVFSQVMEKLGHPECYSGYDLSFLMLREDLFPGTGEIDRMLVTKGQTTIFSTKKAPLDSFKAIEGTLRNIDEQIGWKEIIAGSQSINFVTQDFDTLTIDMAGNVG